MRATIYKNGGGKIKNVFIIIHQRNLYKLANGLDETGKVGKESGNIWNY